MSTQPFLIAQATSIEIQDGQIIREMRESVLKSRVQGPPPIKNHTAAKLADAAKKEQTEADRKKVLLEKDAATKPVGEELDAGDKFASAAGEQVASENEKALNLPTDGSAAASESKFNPILGLPLLLLLGGSGGGSGSGGNNPAALIRFNGLVVDGYIRDATVYLDSNNDGLQSPGESVTTSTPTGTFSVQGPAAAPFIGYGGTDTATGLPNVLTLYAPAGYNIVSPLTSLVYFASRQTGISSAAAQSLIKSALGLSASIDLATFDPFATPTSIESLAVEKVTAEVAIALSLAPDAATQSVWLQALAQQAASKATLGQTLDLSSAALFQSLGMPTAMAQKVADIYKLIQAADTIADVTTIQRAALDSGNDAPMFLTKLITATVAENSAIGTLLTTVTAIDPDQGNSVSYTLVGPDASKLSINSIGEIRLAVIPDYEGQTSFSFTVVASDVLGAFSSKAGTVNIIDVNDLPALIGGPLANQSATQNAAFSAEIPASAFGPADVVNTLTLTATLADGSALPAWLSFNAATRTFTGTPGEPQVGSVDVKVIATDTAVNVGNGTFNISVANVNDAPTGAVSISGSAIEGQTLTAVTTTLADADGLGVLNYLWQRSADGSTGWTGISGATATSYILVNADSNQFVRVLTSYVDGHGTTESVASTALARVINVLAAPLVSLATDTGANTSDDITSIGTLNVSAPEAGATIQYSINGGTAWSSSFTAVEGSNVVQVRQIDGFANASPTTSLSFTLDTTIAQPTVALSSDTGTSGDLITSNAVLSLSALAGDVTRSFKVDGGTASATYTAPTADGSHTVLVTDTDSAGNTKNASLTFTLDTTASVSSAAITGAQDATLPVTGNVPNGGASNETALVLSGTVDAAFSTAAGDEVVVYDAGTEIGIAVVTGSTWAFTTPPLADAVHSFTVIVRDVAGNLGDESVEYFVVTDTIAPLAPPAPMLDAASDLGFNDPAADNLTSDATPTINVSATLNDGEVLHLYMNSGSGAVEVATFGIPGGAIVPYSLSDSYTPGANLADASYTFSTQVTDAAGNASASLVNLTVIIDTAISSTLASVDAIDDNVAPQTGPVLDGGATNDPTLDLSGSTNAPLAADEKVALYDGGTFLGYSGAGLGATTWAYTANISGEGTHSFTARVVRASGALGDESVEYVAVLDTIAPLVAPPAPVLAAASDLGFNDPAADNLTSDATPTINVSATLNDGEVLHLYMNSGSGAVEVATFGIPGGATGPYLLTGSFTPTADLTDGSHTFSTQVTDAAGNASTSVTGTPVIIDTLTSTSQATVDQAIDDIGLFTGLVGHLDTDAAPYAHQSVTNDTTLSLGGTIDNPLAADGSERVAVYDGGSFLGWASAAPLATTWSYAANIIGDGTHAFTARVVRASGAPGDESATLQVVLNTTTPDVSLDFHSGPSGSIIDVSSAGIRTLVDASPGTPTLDAFALSGFDAATLTTNEVLAISGNFVGSLNLAATVEADINTALDANTGSFDTGSNLILLLKDLASPDDSTVWRYQDGSNGGLSDGRVQTGELSRLGEMTFASGSSLELLLAENFKLHP